MGKNPYPRNWISAAADWMVDSVCLIWSTAGSDCSPMNFRVTWSDSGLAQRASGANPLTPATKREMRSRMASVMSSAMKRRMGGLCGGS